MLVLISPTWSLSRPGTSGPLNDVLEFQVLRNAAHFEQQFLSFKGSMLKLNNLLASRPSIDLPQSKPNQKWSKDRTMHSSELLSNHLF